MLKGLLSTLKAAINQRFKKPLNQEQSPQNQGQNEALKIVGLNLLSDFQPATGQFQKHIITISNLRKIIIVLSSTFGLLLVLNYFIFIHIAKLKTEQNRLSSGIVSLSESEKIAIKIDKKVTYYKEVLKLRKLVSPRASFVYTKIPVGIEITKLRITYPSFEITAKAKNIYAFTTLITNYLGGGYVSEIVLKSADLNTQTNEYNFAIKGVFK